jgi:hypothetical protein
VGVKFEEQKTFENCKDKHVLKFDFFAEGRLIEYQGEQHYHNRSGRWGRTEKQFQDSLRRDQIKRDFCKENNVPLLEIRYDEKDWQEKLKSFLDNE